MNIENFFDDEDDPAIKEDIVTTETFQNRLKKISTAIRDYLRMPDVIGAIEVENLTALKKLADKINADAVAAKQENPKYEAYLIDGNDGRGIDVGFLVKTSRVKVVEVKQIGKEEKFKNPNSKEEENLNDRPPLMLQATIEDPKTNKTVRFYGGRQSFKVLSSALTTRKTAVRVCVLNEKCRRNFWRNSCRNGKKRIRTENIVLLGDFNAFQFNDGIGDIIGVIKGTPAPKDQVLLASDDLVDPDLIDLVDFIKEDQRYSYSFDGNAQVLDHIIINQAMKKHLAGFGYGRLNADFPQIYHSRQYSRRAFFRPRSGNCLFQF